MKDNIITAVLILIMLGLFFVYPFAIWGGNPEGLWWKVERYQKSNEERIEELEAKQLPIDEISQQIEIIRNQLAQIKLR